MAENYIKFFSKINHNQNGAIIHKPANMEITNTVKKNDLIKILSKVNGTEKLIETIKNGYNESLRELLFEISALKNFVLEINCEIIEYAVKLDLKGLVPLESNFIHMPFLDAIHKIKYALKTNIKKSFDFWNLDDLKINNYSNSSNNNYKTNKDFIVLESIIDNNISNSSNVKNRDNISCIFNNGNNLNENLRNKNNLLKAACKAETDNNNNININNKLPSNSICLIRDKNDSLFENEKTENAKNISNNNNNNTHTNINNEINSFKQTNYDHMIDFDLDNFDLDDSNSNMNAHSIKMNKKINLENKDNCAISSGADRIISNNIIENNFSLNGNFRKNKDKQESNLIDNELEYLKEKWMKALSG